MPKLDRHGREWHQPCVALDINQLFSRAEAAFRDGKFAESRADLLTVERHVEHPAVFHLLGLVERNLGASDAARAALIQAARLAPRDPQIANNLGNLLADRGEVAESLAAFNRAIAAAPDWPDAQLNRALTLRAAGRLIDAREALVALIMRHPQLPDAWSAIAGIGHEIGELGGAADAYDRALTLQPGHPIATRGRARIALERGESDALERYTLLAKDLPGDHDIAIGEAEAREANGLPAPFVRIAALVGANPGWTEGHAMLARMKWEAGHRDGFADSIEQALTSRPRDIDLWTTLVEALAGANQSEAAADSAARARVALGDVPEMMLREAIQAGEAGDDDRAEVLFAAMPETFADRTTHEARHRIRRGEFDRAATLLDRARAAAHTDIDSWALSWLLWRVTDDPRAAWLHEQPGLVAVRELALDSDELDAITARLRSLHRVNGHPLGQSLRHGTQTRGRLFARLEPEIGRLREAITDALAEHWTALPPKDVDHPLLRHRDAPPQIYGSWSVRLLGAGFHVPHTHPQGLLSSASYFVLPEPNSDDPNAGWLEIGRPPATMRIDLPPLATVAPRPGRLVLFPSTLFHGTRPFVAGERITVAFDAAV